MSTGLLALLDDVASITKAAASSLDDVVAQSAKAGAKAVGVVVDDAAVTPRYLVGFGAVRELPIVRRIAIGSLRNKLLFLLPGALALSALAPWLITPLLVLGGAFLCYEGAEKIYEVISPHAAHGHEAATRAAAADPEALEKARIAGAIRTDFILSAEIMAITLSAVSASSLLMQALVLAVVGAGITVLVYSVVALIVKADDAGVALASSEIGPARAIGRGIVVGMPPFLKLLAIVGTAAMLWVGGGIIIHGLEVFGLDAIGHAIHAASDAVAGAVPVVAGAAGWLTGAAASGVFGLAIGAAIIPVVQFTLVPAVRVLRAGGLVRG
jgi:predicted DNA repair protein MutK